jgi:hypothetical protein
MKIYTDIELAQNLALVLDQAAADGEVQIWREDGQVFVIRLYPMPQSPLDVPGLNLGLTTEEILTAIQEGRRTTFLQPTQS